MPTDDSYTVSLLHLDGSDGATSITDESGKTWIANGGAQLDTTYKKFGASSGQVLNEDYWSTPSHADFNFITGDFTIDLWMMNYLEFAISKGKIYSEYYGNYYEFAIQRRATDDKLIFHCAYWVGGTPQNVAAMQTYQCNMSMNNLQWYHVAVVRSGANILMFVDGVKLVDTPIYEGPLGLVEESTPVWLGSDIRYPTPSYDQGWLDEIRISKGIARWTSNFTPPSMPYYAPSTSLQAGIIM